MASPLSMDSVCPLSALGNLLHESLSAMLRNTQVDNNHMGKMLGFLGIILMLVVVFGSFNKADEKK